MIIDFHTHIWPDALAPRAISSLSDTAGGIFTPVTDGTAQGLLSYMSSVGIDISVVQPVITKEKQAFSTNEWAATLSDARLPAATQALKAAPASSAIAAVESGSAPQALKADAASTADCAAGGAPESAPRLVAFGAVWPHSEIWREQVDQAASLGLKGIKFHPEYQQFTVDDEKYIEMYDYILSKGMHILFHAGYDPGYPPPYHSSPAQFARIIRALASGAPLKADNTSISQQSSEKQTVAQPAPGKRGSLILAHLGSSRMWDAVESEIAGLNCYIDTSMGFFDYGKDQFLRIARKHGTDRLLFATDSPWSNAADEIKTLRSLAEGADESAALTAAEIDAILGGNAARLLSLAENEI